MRLVFSVEGSSAEVNAFFSAIGNMASRRSYGVTLDLIERHGAPPGDKDLDDLKMNRREHLLLVRNGIRTVNTLTAKTEAELLQIQRLGAHGLSVIKATLRKHGLSLREPS